MRKPGTDYGQVRGFVVVTKTPSGRIIKLSLEYTVRASADQFCELAKKKYGADCWVSEVKCK